MTRARTGVIGMKKTQRALRAYGQNMDVELKLVVSTTSREILDVAKKSIARRSRGIKRGDRFVSQPGKAPNTNTGRLLSSLKIKNYGLGAEVIADDYRASFLEFGTKKMAARPFLRPAMKRRRFSWNKRLREISKKAALKAGAGK